MAIQAPRRVKKKKNTVGLTLDAEDRLKRKLRGNRGCASATYASPSEPWVEAQIKKDESPERVIYFHDRTVFPPREIGQPATTTKMLCCPRCGRHNPPNATNRIERHGTRTKGIIGETTACDDCMCAPDSKIIGEMRDAGILVGVGSFCVKFYDEV